MGYVEFKNRHTGTQMWVAEDRVEEYKAAGHILAADIAKKPTEEPKAKPVALAKEPVKKLARKK